MKHLVFTTLLGFACAVAHAAPESSQFSRAVGAVSASVVGGSVVLAAAGGSLVVESVRASGDGVDLVLRNAADASVATVRLSGKAAGALSLGAGTVVEVLTSSAGQLLVLSGKAIALIPNEAGKALLHHEGAY